jgi:hypothetical protein
MGPKWVLFATGESSLTGRYPRWPGGGQIEPVSPWGSMGEAAIKSVRTRVSMSTKGGYKERPLTVQKSRVYSIFADLGWSPLDRTSEKISPEYYSAFRDARRTFWSGAAQFVAVSF